MTDLDLDALTKRAKSARIRCDDAGGFARDLLQLIARVRVLEAVKGAAERLHCVVGDGDNGPPSFYGDEWYALDEALTAAAQS